MAEIPSLSTQQNPEAGSETARRPSGGAAPDGLGNALYGVLLGFFPESQAGRVVLRQLRRRTPRVGAVLIHRPPEGHGEVVVDQGGAGVEPAVQQRAARWLLAGESILIAQTPPDAAEDAFDTIRQGRGGRPVTFFFPPTPRRPAQVLQDEAALILATPLPIEQLEEQAEALGARLGDAIVPERHEAASLRLRLRSGAFGKTAAVEERAAETEETLARAVTLSLRERLEACDAALTDVRESLQVASRLGAGLPPAGEWLLDNAFLIREHVEDVRRNLPPRFLTTLPYAPDDSLPRAYHLAAALVAGTDARLDIETITRFLAAFQRVQPLEMGELWAMPLLLRLRLIETLRRLSLGALERHRERLLADFWASRLLSAIRREPERMVDFVAAIKEEARPLTSHLVYQIIGHLQDEDTALAAVRPWAEQTMGKPLPEIIAEAQRAQATEGVSVGHAISSLRTLATVDWRSSFENLSIVDAVLRDGDPSGSYARMDFATRDLYRHAVEEISRGCAPGTTTQVEVAEAAREMARLGEDELRRHVGYWLIDKGRPALEARVAARPPLALRLRRFAEAEAGLLYPSAIGLLTASIVTAAMAGSHALPTPLRLVLLLLALFPASELAVQAVNFLVTRLFAPRSLPKMGFGSEENDEEEGIPADCKTLVVVPMMLLTPDAIASEVERLEIRYLANPEENLKFALLSDYADAPLRHMPEDAERLDAVVRGIEALNQKYGADRFLLFHRERAWSETEDRWIGWERKRGKLEMLNALLHGEGGPQTDAMLRVGDRADLQGIRFVITLDADTQLPKGTAARLVGTLAHPLNAPRLSLDGRRVERGYTIIQPRVTTSLPSATQTRFTRLFTPFAGTDPYTNAVSDVYQDLAGEGSYHGKGIYDVEAFHRVLGGRFPEAHLLSHDLLEGSYVRVGLASDIELFDQFPRDYPSFARREHRWIRGDWQIADWLLPTVPAAGGSREPNPLPALALWKIFDNLRRSLLAPACAFLLLLGWFFTPMPAAVSVLVGAVLALPTVLALLGILGDAAALTAWRTWREFLLTPLRAAVNAALMPHQALLSLNAIFLVFDRRRTGQNLLEWETAAESVRRARDRHRVFVQRMAWVPALALVLGAVLFLLRGFPALDAALPYLLLWVAAPAIVQALSEPVFRRDAQAPAAVLEERDLRMLRGVVRQTWRYFDDFVNAQTSWLPPDNYQEFEGHGIAARTSPTNIGLWLLSCVAARDFGYLTPCGVVTRVRATLDTLEKLEKHRGHLLNWYNTNTAEALHPRYVSWVDSGNLIACLWTLDHAFDEMLSGPFLGPAALHGLRDTLDLVRASLGREDGGGIAEAVAKLEALCTFGPEAAGRPVGVDELVRRLRRARGPAQALAQALGENPATPPTSRYWATQLTQQSIAWNEAVDRYLPWVETLAESPEQGLRALGQEAHEWRRVALENAPSLRALATGDVPGLVSLIAVRLRADALNLGPEVRTWLDRLEEEARTAQWHAGEQVAEAERAAQQMSILADGMDVHFLYDSQRRAFRIGYNVDDARADNSYYDLLASEARLGSFCAVAKGDVPLEHWWALGRPYGEAFGRRALRSWSGTMFEYLMPPLLMRAFDDSLLDDACRTAVACQIAYGRERGIPWGVSEAAYSALDAGHVYQYYAFGVPGLGLKRGLEDSLVVTPYAAALAVPFAPAAAVENLRRLEALGLRGDRGFYESIDYARQNEPTGKRGVAVLCWMAHHQGMALLAIANALNENAFQRRFHRDGRVRAAESLLHERIPFTAPLAEGVEREPPPTLRQVQPESPMPARGQIDTPDTAAPRTHLLSNGAYHVMVTNAGGGYSRYTPKPGADEVEVTRWRADTTRDAYGAFVYLRDLDSGEVWSATYQPTSGTPESFRALFTTEKAEFHRRDHEIETVTEITVSPEDNAEVRRVTLVNRSARPRRIEMTSYAEIALAPHNTDRAHPAFAKLFVQTEALREGNEVQALLANRRPRSSGDATLWAVHALSVGSDAETEGALSFETDRAEFLGRGHTPQSPAALRGGGGALGGGVGPVLDPVFALRRAFVLEPGARLRVAFVTGAGSSRAEVTQIAAKYRDPNVALRRAFELAWNQSQLELRHLRLTQDDAQRFLQLAGTVLYPQATLRPPADRLRRNTQPQQALWKYGISGDLPIVVVAVRDLYDTYVVREVLLAHTFWRRRGLKCDLVILNEEATGYDQPLQDQLVRLTQAHSQYTGMDQPGGVFLRPVKDIPEADRTLLTTVARAVIVAARGPLAQQLAAATVDGHALSGKSAQAARAAAAMSGSDSGTPLPPLAQGVQDFNGIGGFTADGTEYVVTLDGPDAATPAPWSNVIANENFGALVTESGGGYTWHGNSQSNRLTPWSNDPVSDPISEAIYLRDEETGRVWTPTPLPIREATPYRTRHGHGYTLFEHNSGGIEQRLTVFIAAAGAKVYLLHLKNATDRARRLTATAYAAWSLGVEREDTQLHVVTDWDADAGMLTARNAYRPDFGGCVTFLASSLPPIGSTGDRTEFLGRNGSSAAPAALYASRPLAGSVGAGADPCGALQVEIALSPGEETQVVFLLGEASDLETARSVAASLKTPEAANAALEATRSEWKRLLGAVTVETPDEGANRLLNGWLLYQDLSCRIWGRSAFYQSGGAYGFRDQLQDVMAVLYAAPELARAQIIRSAARQFLEGDVQHWWHPPSGAGVRTLISDDLLWLPFVTAQYVRVTGDEGILQEQIPFLKGKPLEGDEHEAFYIPEITEEKGTLLEHCRRAIDKGFTASELHGLPKIGGGDWNDGMNRVGIGGKGESVWLAWFLCHVLHDWAELLERAGDQPGAKKARADAGTLAATVERSAWDGAWYRRAYYDDGTPLGSAESDEAKIDSLAQSWAVISGVGDPERVRTAMESVEKNLVKRDAGAASGMVLLFTPPFDKTPHDPGYIKGYLPGVRENGGQYTHGSLWVPLAHARLGDGDGAVDLLRRMSPVEHTRTPEAVARYKVEPYVVVADIYALEGQMGRGGWTWYTGSAGWMYRVWLEEVLGLRLRGGDRLTLDPCLPKGWQGFTLTYRHGSAVYRFTVENPSGIHRGVAEMTLDDSPLPERIVPLTDDGKEHAVRVVLGATDTVVPAAPAAPAGASERTNGAGSRPASPARRHSRATSNGQRSREGTPDDTANNTGETGETGEAAKPTHPE